MSSFTNSIALVKALASNPQMLRVRPSVNLFLANYMRKFQILNVDGQLIIHSHLPAVNSRAYTRFINEHLLGKAEGPSHAQISLTNECPQNCAYCYNKNRRGRLLEKEDILKSIQQLKEMGVFWLGFTGGEPLLNKDIVEIIHSAGKECAIKLFTTGAGLTEELALEMKEAGLNYVSVSLDHWNEEVHDQIRGVEGAYETALKGIEIFLRSGIHVSVSGVVSKEMMHGDQLEEYLEFLIRLGVHEAWLSEAKPSVEAMWEKDAVITEEERKALVQLQDRYNKENRITVNYLGHFEGAEHFGCNAGNKMVYIDAFGEVSPCVFTPMTFGNIREEALLDIFGRMKQCFPSEGSCFINKNYALMKKYHKGGALIGKEDSLAMMKEVQFSPPAEFNRRQYKISQESAR